MDYSVITESIDKIELVFDFLKNFFHSYRIEIMAFSCVILIAGLLQNIIYFLQIPFAAFELWSLQMREQEEHSWWLLTSNITIPMSVLIPAYNEEKTIVETVGSALSTKYPSLEVIVINDGSLDKTLHNLIEHFYLKEIVRFFEPALLHQPIKKIYSSSTYPNLIVVDKISGGRSDALNVGIDISRTSIFCTLDGDSLLDPPALLKTIQPFLEKPYEMMAVGGTVRVQNKLKVKNGVQQSIQLPKNPLVIFQINEYIRAFLIGRLAWSRLKIIGVISGAFAVFRRDIVIKVGGFNPSTIGEDFELVMKIHNYCNKNKVPYDMRFVPEPVCWTMVPQNFYTLAQQRIRWQQGALEVLYQNKKMFLNPKYGRIGLLGYPIFFLSEVVGPVFEVLGIIFLPAFYILGALNTDVMVAFICLFFILGIFFSAISLVLEELSLKRFRKPYEIIILGIAAILENFGYRQLNNFWRIVGTWRFLVNRQNWGHKSHQKKKKSY